MTGHRREPVLEKIDEELDEMRAAMAAGDRDAMEDELGDLLFVAVNLARQLDIDPGTALRRSNAKFEQRFRAMEEAAGGQDGLDAMSLDEMEDLWQGTKRLQAARKAATRDPETGAMKNHE